MYLDMNFWLPYDILLKADKMTMAHSLELRVPFLDKEIFNMARQINSKYMVNNTTTKYVFREAANKVVPSGCTKVKRSTRIAYFQGNDCYSVSI